MQTQAYHIHSILGQGGMAKVYLAEHKTLGHKVAIKVLNKEFVHNENIRKRFLAEARNLAKMNHPHVVRVMDLIEEGDMVAFVMEYIEGQTLRDYLDQKGKLPDNEIKKLFGQMLEAVGYVHEQGLVHRDIKPSNFMLDSRGNIKLLDFGIAKTMDPGSAEYTQTATSQHMGTPMYMSPEQVKSTKDVTTQSDIYSLGVVLWQMAAGRTPYDTSTISTFEIQTMIVNEPLPETGRGWDDIIEKATKKDLKSRFKSIQNVNLEKPKSQKLPKQQSNEFEKTVVQSNFRRKVEIQPPPPKRDKIFTETIKDPNEREPFSLNIWVFVIVTGFIILGLIFYSREIYSGLEASSNNEILDTKAVDISSGQGIDTAASVANNQTLKFYGDGEGVTDIDGNTYKTVVIGNQEWTAENLSVTKFNDGTPIKKIGKKWGDEWENIDYPGYSWIDNDPEYKMGYGALYNGYCIENEKLCPIGWHVPTDEEWSVLIEFLGGDSIAKDRILDEKVWTHSHQESREINSAGFCALPAGCREFIGPFFGAGTTAWWWSYPDASGNKWVRAINGNNKLDRLFYNYNHISFSVRCVKD